MNLKYGLDKIEQEIKKILSIAAFLKLSNLLHI